MLPRSLLTYELRDDSIVPRYLSARDEHWVRVLIDVTDALIGRSVGEASQRLGQEATRIAHRYQVPPSAVQAVRHLLQRSWRTQVRAAVPPHEIRRVVFEIGSDRSIPRREVIHRAAIVLGIRAEEVSDGLFADHPSERRLLSPAIEPTARSVVVLYNLALLQGILLSSDSVRIASGGDLLPAARGAKMARLLWSYVRTPERSFIDVSGPRALARHTLVYVRALTDWLARSMFVDEASIEARCTVEGKSTWLRTTSSEVAELGLGQGDPATQRDSLIVTQLLRDAARGRPAWSARPADEPVYTEAGHVFLPELVLERAKRVVYLELLGYYTPDYVTSQLAALRQASAGNYLLAANETMSCRDGTVSDVRFLLFRKRINLAASLRAAEALGYGTE